ncbi:TPA: hypothetical protein ACP32N_005068 [Pseudomonas aeruginosa]
MGCKEEQSEGFIEFLFLDGERIVTLGGKGFLTKADVKGAWANLQNFRGESAFRADRLDSARGLVDTKQVSAETCETPLGRPIAALMAEGRARRKALLEGRPSEAN